MRRNHSLIESIDTSLIIHFPLDSENGLTDVVSGNTLSVNTNYGSVVWNNIYGMYLFTSTNTSNPVASIPCLIPSSVFENGITIIGIVKRGVTNIGQNVFYTKVGAQYVFNGTYNTSGNITGNSNNWIVGDNVTKFAQVYNGLTSTKRKFYQDGALKYSDSTTLTNTEVSQIQFGYYVWGATTRSQYIKDFRIYSRELTLTEIRQIQGYE